VQFESVTHDSHNGTRSIRSSKIHRQSRTMMGLTRLCQVMTFMGYRSNCTRTKTRARKPPLPPLSVRRVCREFAADALKRQTRDFQTARHSGGGHPTARCRPLRGRNGAGCRALCERGFDLKEEPSGLLVHSRIRPRWRKPRSNNQHTKPFGYVKFPRHRFRH